MNIKILLFIICHSRVTPPAQVKSILKKSVQLTTGKIDGYYCMATALISKKLCCFKERKSGINVVIVFLISLLIFLGLRII